MLSVPFTFFNQVVLNEEYLKMINYMLNVEDLTGGNKRKFRKNMLHLYIKKNMQINANVFENLIEIDDFLGNVKLPIFSKEEIEIRIGE